jgi:signal transduction histidine kinase
VALSFLLTWLITRPVARLLQATRSVQRGDYSLRLPCESADELGRLTEAFNAMTAGLGRAERTRQEKELLQRDFLHRLMAGQEGERKRIARELHDQSGQALASFMVELKVLEATENPQALREGIQRLQKAITLEMGALHDLAMELRPSVLDDLGLIPAVEMLVKNFKVRHGLSAELTVVGFGSQRAETCTETCVYRIVQESLTNIARHARATAVTVLLEWRGDTIRGVIEDDGIGFDPLQPEGAGKLGVFGMRERVQLLQGSFRIESAPEQGTMVVFAMPAKVEVCHERA